ncbi:MAG TPA: glycosyltransferase family 2 protein [Thermoanaerobaculia bacterium]|nr:glycosyltransferase family 2 protein [Thermoanaerobaculia bacterium]
MRGSLLLAGLAACTAVGFALRVNRQRRRAPALPRAAPRGSAATSVPPRPRVAVLLPVRDEEDNLLPCLDTLLDQTIRPDVLVVDDGSTDATRRLAEERVRAERGPAEHAGDVSAETSPEGTGPGRLEVIGAPPPPAGWGGKVHALETGYRHLAERPSGAPEWILSTDADTRHHPELLARTLAAAEAFGLDAVSVAGYQEVAELGENLLTPPVFALLDALLPDWAAAARGDGPAVANGQFILLRERALAAIGGFAAVAGAPIDDVALVTRLREAGHRTGFWRAPDLLRVRMYRGFAGTFEGWRRNLGGIFGPQPAPTRRILAALLAGPAVLLALLLTGRRRAAALLWAGGATASALLRHAAGHRPGWALLHPLDALVLAATLSAGVGDWRRGKLARWRGREVRASAG